jgi:hypothetical protein
MKSILLPVGQNEQMPSAFETAWLAASLLDGVVEGAAGAYTQSRLRQMIFGGATQHVLTAAELPVCLVD